jgi:hypothetical protein
MEPGLSSPAVFRHWHGAAVRPTDALAMGLSGPRVKREADLPLKNARACREGDRPGLGARDKSGRSFSHSGGGPRMQAARVRLKA